MSPPSFYAGLDTAVFPGLDWARRVYNGTNIWCLGYYLGGQNAAKGTETWLGNRAALVEIGFGLIPVYVGQQVDGTRFYDDLTADRGRHDGAEASGLMRQEGFPKGSVCYLDVEDRTATADLITYVGSWIGMVVANGFRPGVYCDAAPRGVADLLYRELAPRQLYLWALPAGEDIYVSVTPDEGPNGYLSYPPPDPTQYHQNALGAQWAEATGDDPIKVLGVEADLNSFIRKDPSMPDKKEPDVNTGPGYPERQLDVTANGWLYDTATNTWVRLSKYPNADLKTDKSGYPYLPPPKPAPVKHTPTADDIVAAARRVKGAKYRQWKNGNPIPMWLMDNAGDPPPPSHIFEVGIECSDLINLALEYCGLPPGGGTLSFKDYLIKQVPFDPNSPGIPGGVAFRPFEGEQGQDALVIQGHLALYVDEHTLIQALIFQSEAPGPGVTEAYTDIETYNWGGDTQFTIYALLPGVDYSKYLSAA